MCEHCKQEIKGGAIRVHRFEFHSTCFTKFLAELNERRRKQAEEDASEEKAKAPEG